MASTDSYSRSRFSYAPSCTPRGSAYKGPSGMPFRCDWVSLGSRFLSIRLSGVSALPAPALLQNGSDSSLASQLALPRTAASLLAATVSSSSKKVLHASLASGKTRPHSARFLFALQSGCATSIAFQVGSCQKLAASNARRQDGVQRSLTLDPCPRRGAHRGELNIRHQL
jgi:hypothetical protein